MATTDVPVQASTVAFDTPGGAGKLLTKLRDIGTVLRPGTSAIVAFGGYTWVDRLEGCTLGRWGPPSARCNQGRYRGPLDRGRNALYANARTAPTVRE